MSGHSPSDRELLELRIESDFTYHAPNELQRGQYERLRAAAKDLAHLINRECPGSREKSTALTRLDEVVFWANAAIARAPAEAPHG